MSAAHWTQKRRWNAGRPRRLDTRPNGGQGAAPKRRKRLADMTAEERAAYEVSKAQDRQRKAEAFAAMTDEQRAAIELARQAEGEARAAVRARRRVRALAVLNEHVDAMWSLADLPLAAREATVPQSEATMRGTVLAEFARPNGGRRLVLLREWQGRLRILRTLAYVENGRPVRSRGDTIHLHEMTTDGEVVVSFRELDEEIAVLRELRTRLESDAPTLAAQLAALREGRTRLERTATPGLCP
ncbi:MAG TPA: hypothetical protein VEK07_20840 [Polyangiaceae bacterium]|nr:hypothetical protein [Polyangiaceae bacterium]